MDGHSFLTGLCLGSVYAGGAADSRFSAIKNCPWLWARPVSAGAGKE